MPVPMLDSPEIHVIRDQFEAWMNGAIARIADLALHENPHRKRSAKGDAWENAWEVIDHNLRDAQVLIEARRRRGDP